IFDLLLRILPVYSFGSTRCCRMNLPARKYTILSFSFFLVIRCCYADDPIKFLPLSGNQIENDSSKESNSQPETNQSTSIKRTPQNFMRNMKGLFTRSNLNALLIGAPATGISTIFDDDIHNYFRTRIDKNTAFANIGAAMGETYVLIPAVG